MNNLDPSRPVVMHIRHSAREQTGYYSALSEEGKEAAYEFGTLITSGRKTRLYHTVLLRSQETAQKIHQALSNQGTESTVIGELNIVSTYSPEKFRDHMKEIFDEFQVQGVESIEQLNAYMKQQNSPFKTNVLRWLSGHYSPLERRPSLDFVQHVTGVMMKNLKSAEQNSLDIYISHDTWIAAFLFHWFGVIPITWIKYLDGFMIQIYEQKIKLLLPNESKEIHYPYWWKHTT